jgi:hypothetical protein
MKKRQSAVLGAMVASLCLYIAVHSPVRGFLAAWLGLPNRRCYLVCSDSLTAGRLVDSVSGIAALVLSLLAAWCLVDWLDSAPYERPLIFGIATFALVVVPAAVIGGIAEWSNSTLLSPPAGPLLTAVPAAVILAAGVAWKRWRPHSLQWEVSTAAPVRIVEGLAGGLLAVSMILSFVHPPTGYDALSYHAPLAAFLWRDGNLGSFLNRLPEHWTLAHPGSAELWNGLLGIVGGESLANLGQLPLALLGSAAIYAFSRRMGFFAGAARLGGAAFLLAPLVVAQAGMQLNDIAGAALLMGSVTLASAPAERWALSRYALVGLTLGMVTTTKLALVPGVIGVLAFVTVTVIWRYRHTPKSWVAGLLTIAALFAVVVTPWWTRNLVRYGNPVYPAAIPLIGRGISQAEAPKDNEFVPSASAWILYPVLEPQNEQSGFGTLFIVGALPGLLVAAIRRRRRPAVLYVVLMAFMLAAWWTLTRREPRFLLTLFGLGFAFLPWSLVAVPRAMRWAGSAVLCVAAVFSAVVTCDQVLLPFARQPSTRSEFYDRHWNVDPAVAGLPESEGLIYNLGLARFSYPGYYALLGPSQKRLVIPLETAISNDEIVDRMQRAGVQYAYIPASTENCALVEARFGGSRFELVHVSTAETPAIGKTRRYLYRLKLAESARGH